MISPRYVREIPQRYRLESGKCKKCGTIFYPPRLVCSKCKSQEFEKVNLNNEGKILTFTIIRVGSEKYSQEIPYAIGIIELNDGVRLMAQIVDTDFEKIAIGKKVKLFFRKIQEDGKAGILCYGYKAVVI